MTFEQTTQNHIKTQIFFSSKVPEALFFKKKNFYFSLIYLFMGGGEGVRQPLKRFSGEVFTRKLN